MEKKKCIASVFFRALIQSSAEFGSKGTNKKEKKKLISGVNCLNEE